MIRPEDVRPAPPLGVDLLPPSQPRHRSQGALGGWYAAARPTPTPDATDARRGR